MHFSFKFLPEGSKESILGLLDNKYFIVSDVLYGNCRMQNVFDCNKIVMTLQWNSQQHS